MINKIHQAQSEMCSPEENLRNFAILAHDVQALRLEFRSVREECKHLLSLENTSAVEDQILQIKSKFEKLSLNFE